MELTYDDIKSKNYDGKDIWIYAIEYGEGWHPKRKVTPTKVLVKNIDYYFDFIPYGKNGKLIKKLKSISSWQSLSVKAFDDEKECIDEYVKSLDSWVAYFKKDIEDKIWANNIIIENINELKSKWV